VNINFFASLRGLLVAFIWGSLLACASAQNLPFPQHVTYAAGTAKPDNVTQAAMDSTVTNFWSQWAKRYLKTTGKGGQYYVAYNIEGEGDPGAATVSEAHGYGMVLSAYMAGADPLAKTYYDGLYAYYKAHPSDNNPALMAWEQDTSFNDMNGADSATDGDMDIAYSLLLADKQWGSSGAINYFQAATNMIYALMQSDVNQNAWTLRLGDWATSGTSKGFAYATATRPSDFMFDHLRSYFEATGDGRWTNVINQTYAVINMLFTNNSPNTGLIPDFVVLNGSSYQPAPANFLEAPTDGEYNYNSCRTPWRFATDYLLRGTSESLTEERKMNSWIIASSRGNTNQVYPGYTLSGTPLDTSYTDSSFTSPFGVNAMIDATNQTWVNDLWTWNVSGGINANDGYFGNSIKMHCLIVMSGNWWAPVESTLLDSDGDGIPDVWMLQYFGHPTGQAADKSRASDDADGDGVSNLNEYLAGTNPTNATSFLHLTSLTVTTSGVRATWTTTPSRTYVLQMASKLGGTNKFADVSLAISAPGTGESRTNFTDTSAKSGLTGRFYRVRLGP